MEPGANTDQSVKVIYLCGVRYERDPMSAMFEDLPNEELMMLAQNIKTEGQKLPVTVNSANGLVLDGWQRLRACQLIEAEPRVVEDEIPNPAAFVMAVNEHRRGSTAPTAPQRVLLATDLLMLEWEARGGKGHKPSAKKVAAAAGCSTGTVEHARRGLRWDTTHDTDYEGLMRSGRMSAKRVNDEIMAVQWAEKNRPRQQPDGTPVAPKTARPSISKVSSHQTMSLRQMPNGRKCCEIVSLRCLRSGFEHFAGALLRATGSTEVDVIGGSGDGGIDGVAIQSGLVPVRIAFQCKRYQGSVGAPGVRDFRGSFIGRCDRGLIITTGTFTHSAKEEASRPGANPVDLIDGEALCDLLKEHELGVHVTERIVKDVTIDETYFDQFERD